MREMKDSGIAGIGYIPKSWEVRRIKTLGAYRNGLTYSPNDICGDEGTLVLRASNVKNGRIVYDDNVFVSCVIKSELMVESGDILICSRSGSKELIGKSAIIDENANASFGAFMMIFRCDEPKYMFYVLNSPVFTYYLGTFFTSTINQLTGANFGDMKIAYCPNKMEKSKIVKFLDKKCTEIDALTADIQTQIENLEQYKQSVITEAVTRGMRKGSNLKESGVAWCPLIPDSWIVTNPKALFVPRLKRAQKGERQLTASQKHGIIYQDDFLDLESQKVVTVEKGFSILKQVEPSDFVISMRSFQGGLEYSEVRGSISSAYVMLIPNAEKVYPPFYRWFFKSSKYINAIQSTTNLVRDGQAMRYENFVQVPLFIIPIEEQKEIAKYLNGHVYEIDAVLMDKKAQLETLEEYKKSLIYEYVTGKKEVPA